jgi:hypothetical protein
VLLKRLGIQVQENCVDAKIKDKFREAFRGNISSTKKQAMQILLNGEIDFSALELNLAGLEDEQV